MKNRRRTGIKPALILTAALSAALILLFSLSSFAALPASASEDTGDGSAAGGRAIYFNDGAGLLSDSEAEIIETALGNASAKTGLDTVIVTRRGYVSDYDSMNYADDWFDYNGYSKNGVLLLVDIAPDGSDRFWWISTAGEGISVFTDYGIDLIFDGIQDSMSGSDDYMSAFRSFAKQTIEYKNYYDANGAAIDIPPEKFSPAGPGIIAALSGLFVSLISTSKMKNELRTVSPKSGASDYVKPGSLAITGANEVYLYSSVARSRIESDSSSRGGGGGSSTHTSSSGTSHGGGGRHF